MSAIDDVINAVPTPEDEACQEMMADEAHFAALAVVQELRERLRNAGPNIPRGWWVWGEIDAIEARLKGESDG